VLARSSKKTKREKERKRLREKEKERIKFATRGPEFVNIRIFCGRGESLRRLVATWAMPTIDFLDSTFPFSIERQRERGGNR
jgi:hypothetical protein